MPRKPLVLAFDTSAAHCAAALLSGPEIVSQRLEVMAKGQAESLFPILEDTLSDAGASWTDLSVIGVGTGPGNFTGTRLAVSAVRGLAVSLGCPAIGITGLEALAHGQQGSVLAVLDARRDQVYVQKFDKEESNPPRLGTISEPDLAADLPIDVCIGFDAERIAFMLNARAATANANPAINIALLAAARMKEQHYRPAPLYLRSADAAPSSEPTPVILP